MFYVFEEIKMAMVSLSHISSRPTVSNGDNLAPPLSPPLRLS